MKIWITVILLGIGYSGAGQVPDSLSLPWLQQKARENYPVLKQKDILAKASDIRLQQLSDTWLPKLDMNGQASYQSDVTELGISTAFFKPPVIDKDIERLNLNVSQVIYDGKQVSTQKAIEQANLQLDQQNVEIQLYQIREKINLLFFAYAFYEENDKILLKFQEDLSLKLKNAESGVAHGVLLESEADVIRAELVKMEQRIIELDDERQNALDMLSQWTGQNLSLSRHAGMPKADIGGAAGIKSIRPELVGFELQQSRLEANKNLVSTKNIPKLAAFGEAGYGKPGYNMFHDGFDTYYMLGAKLSWSMWDWHQARKEKDILDFQKEIVSTQSEAFELNTKVAAIKQISEVQKYRDLMQKDDRIIGLREKISHSAAAQLENGVITSTDYLIELNQEIQARMSKETHRLQEVKARVDFLTIQGINIQ
ncbi:MAG: TolC family protein [Bacteroidota bacterium]